MGIFYKKNHTNYYSEIILEITDNLKDRIRNIDKLEKKILKVLSENKGE